MRSTCYILIAVLAAMPLHAQERNTARTFTLTGRVLAHGTDVPVPHATVEIRELDRHTFADSAGWFVFPDVPEGAYTFATSRLGYMQNAEPSSVRPGQMLIVRLEPRPILLEELAVTADRLEERVNRIGYSVRAAGRDELLHSTAPDMVAFVRSRLGVVTTPCRGDSFGRRECVRVRGSERRVNIHLNDGPMPGGAGVLEHFRPQELYRVEVFPSVAMIRLYTPRYIERVASTDWNLPPICIIC